MNKENDDEVFLYSGAEPLNRDEITVMKSFFHANIFVPLSGNNLKRNERSWRMRETENLNYYLDFQLSCYFIIKT